MAKTEKGGFLGHHVEKLAVAVAAIALVFVVFYWVVSSPRTIELAPIPGVPAEKAAYPPNQVDDALAKIAEGVDKNLANVKPPILPVPPYSLAIGEISKNPLATAEQVAQLLQVPYNGPSSKQPVGLYRNMLPGNLALKPENPPVQIKLELAEFAKALGQVGPQKPLAAVCREVVALPVIPAAAPAGGAAPAATAAFEYKEVLSAHVVAVFEWGKVQAMWDEVFKKAYLSSPRPIYLAVIVERQQRTGDGPWSAPVVVDAFKLPGLPALPVVPKPDDTNWDKVSDAVKILADFQSQQLVLQPVFASIMYPSRAWGSWCVEGHKPLTPLSAMAEESGMTPSPTMPMPAPIMPVPGGAERGGERGIYGPREGRLDSRDRREMMRDRGGDDFDPVMRRPPGAPTPGVPVAPVVAPTPGLPAAPAVANDPKPVTVPSMQTQLTNSKGIMEFWIHDTQLQEGMTYRYRLQLLVVNPLLGRARDVKAPDDAKTIAIASAWSDWSEKATVPRATEFYLTGSGIDSVMVDVFTKKMGQTLMHTFKVRRGEPIGQESVEMDIAPLDSGAPKKEKVDFRTGAVAVDFDFDKKVTSGSSNIATSTTEMIFVAADGQLNKRLLSVDQVSKQYAEMKHDAGGDRKLPVTSGPVLPPRTGPTPPNPLPQPPHPNPTGGPRGGRDVER